ncbi:hypothetical protein [Streptomyces sp. C184]|uniref:hypothetical protein n=1 Tax=Streptomyces sp. C184 TaxID=3237121 RepID=UPI0034C61449
MWRISGAARKIPRERIPKPPVGPMPSREHSMRRFAFILLDHLSAWRERAVEQIEITNALWSERERVIDVKPLLRVEDVEGWGGRLGELLVGQSPDQGSAEVLLPLASLPKDALFDFRMSVNGTAVFRIPRDENGGFQAEYMEHLAQRAGYRRRLSDDLLSFMACAFSFSSSTWGKFYNEYHKPLRRPIRYAKRVCRLADPVRIYVEERRGQGIADWDYDRWTVERKAISKIVGAHVLRTPRSSTENPILAVPKFQRTNQLDDEYVSEILRELRLLLRWAQGKVDAYRRAHPHEQFPPDVDAAYELVSTYYCYGRRWEAMTKCWVPLDEPFRIHVHERRVIRFDSPKWSRYNLFAVLWEQLFPRAHYNISFADAKSNHLHIRVPDQHAQLVKRKCHARSDKWEKLQESPDIAGCPDDEHSNHEYYSRYDTRNRDERIWVVCRLRQALFRWFMTWGMILVTLSAEALLLMFGAAHYDDNTLHGADIAVILLPVTVVVSLLLTRETSTLGVRVKRFLHSCLMLTLLGLWVTAFVLYVMHKISIDGALAPPPRFSRFT